MLKVQMGKESRSEFSLSHKRLYNSARWKQLRLRHLAKEPLCRMCKMQGIVTIATICDHIRPHRGIIALFYSASNLQSLCKQHHDSAKQSEERRGKAVSASGVDGWPINI